MKRLRLLSLGLAMFAFGAFLAGTAITSAHERRQVQDYTFVVGWLTEPALLNQPNSIDMRVSKTADSSPVSGLEKTVKAEVINGTAKAPVELKPRSGTPGAYNGYIMPTKEGDYSFHFTGTVEGMNLDQTFTSGPSTFATIAAANAFPDPNPSTQSLDESVRGLQEKVVTLESKNSSSKANSAMIIAIVGVIVGAAGVGIGVYGMTRKAA
ncbi:MAG TPA: hypothetical protein VH951_12800 [Dehalococcoidia bacterium]